MGTSKRGRIIPPVYIIFALKIIWIIVPRIEVFLFYEDAVAPKICAEVQPVFCIKNMVYFCIHII